MRWPPFTRALELHDVVTITAKPAPATTITPDLGMTPAFPTDERNTRWKMVELALKAAQLHIDAEVANP